MKKLIKKEIKKVEKDFEAEAPAKNWRYMNIPVSEVIAETAKGVLIMIDKTNAIWFAKKTIKNNSTNGFNEFCKTYTLSINVNNTYSGVDLDTAEEFESDAGEVILGLCVCNTIKRYNKPETIATLIEEFDE